MPRRLLPRIQGCLYQALTCCYVGFCCTEHPKTALFPQRFIRTRRLLQLYITPLTRDKIRSICRERSPPALLSSGCTPHSKDLSFDNACLSTVYFAALKHELPSPYFSFSLVVMFYCGVVLTFRNSSEQLEVDPKGH